MGNYKKPNKKPLQVSDHAVLRYIERVMEIDIEKIKAIILSDRAKAFADNGFGDGTFPNGDHRAVVKDKMIVTVLENE